MSLETVFAKNVNDWIDRLQPHHWEQGKTWYKHAHQQCRHLSEDTGTPLENVCGIMSALSPQVSWEVNLTSCEAVVRDGKINDGYTGYGINVAKAYQCLMSPPLNVLKGPKVLAFYHNILDPNNSLDVTVDTHIGRVLYDSLTLTRGQQSSLFNKPINSLAQVTIQKYAKKKRVIPHVLQASLWVCVREKVRSKVDKNQLPLYIK